MREKLLDLMKNEGLKPSQLAEMLEINPAGVSHILAGRNKPGFDLLQKILRRFPRINPDWLLLDSDKMYRDDATRQLPAQPHPAAADHTLFETPAAASVQQPTTTAAPSVDSPRIVTEAITRLTSDNVERVVIFYDDKTFESYSPTKR